MNKHIKNAFLKGRLVLLLGAGASYGSKNKRGNDIPLGGELAEILAEESDFEYHGEDLSRVYGAVKSKLGGELHNVLEEQFKHCRPSKEYLDLAKFPFARIYTLNIDDALDKALHKNSQQDINIRSRNDRVSQVDQFFKEMDFVKLNGDISKLADGFIFSPQEYGGAADKMPLWYEELGSDFYKYTFVFVGTKLNEPLFYTQIERYKAKSFTGEQRSYVITPNITEIDRQSLATSNVEHISGTLGNFVEWLKTEFPRGMSPENILLNSRPELDLSSVANINDYQRLFKNVTPVSRGTLSLVNSPKVIDSVRSFYKGSKPTWREILDGVPAFLCSGEKVYRKLVELNASDRSELLCVFGNAGSGKTTLLKQLALKLSEGLNANVYFIENVDNDLTELIYELESRNPERYFVFIDRLVDTAYDLGEVIKSGRAKKCTFVGAEIKSIWSARVKEHLGEFCTAQFDVTHIDVKDAERILPKVQEFGNWTRLSKMSHKDRVTELVKKSSKQLLIGLMETTSGEGYSEIIRKDFDRLPSDSHRNLLILVGLATAQRTAANEATLTRAMNKLGSSPNITTLVSDMDGIVNNENGRLSARHRVYIDRLFDRFVDKERLVDCIKAYVDAFTVYDTPIKHNVSSSEFSVYKYLVNAKTLKKYLRNNESYLTDVYSTFEKKLEKEGLFLLQYGLMLRSFGRQPEAYEKIRNAHEAYPESPQIEHALALQRIIMANMAETEAIAMSYFDLAKDVLERLDKAGVRVFDAYPIITLSEGHVKITDKFLGTSPAKIIAREYHDDIKRRLGKSSTLRLQQTAEKLQKFYLSGQWMSSEDDLIH